MSKNKNEVVHELSEVTEEVANVDAHRSSQCVDAVTNAVVTVLLLLMVMMKQLPLSGKIWTL